uniref:Elongation of very long chain fatty acids protein n=1 Tax=Parastrongyloides trichosuri TaxID=131310 RepID=A0A0N5A597_PARTI
MHFFIFIFLLPNFLYHFFKGPYSLICVEEDLYTNRHSRWSVGMFTLSKSWLLVDTFITMALRRPLNYDSVIHHGFVLLQVGFTYKSAGSSVRLPIMLNSLISMITYYYFIGLYFRRKVGFLRRYIIIGQRWQFVICVSGIFLIKMWKNREYKCDTSNIALDFNLVVISLFLILSFLKS